MAFQTACFIMALRLNSTSRRLRRSGGAMFKIYVGRDENGELRQNQIEAMRALFAEGKGA